MAQPGGEFGGPVGGSGNHSGAKPATGAGRTVPHALPAEARLRSRPDGKTFEPRTRRRPAPVTPGQERLVLAAFESGLKSAAIAQEFRVSRAGVEVCALPDACRPASGSRGYRVGCEESAS